MAYLIRLEFLDESFKEDLEKILRMAPYHIDMMISTAIQMAMASQAKQPGVKAINVKVIKTLIEFSQNIMQGLWDKDSPYWQLPYITDDKLKIIKGKLSAIPFQLYCRLNSNERKKLALHSDEKEF